MTKEASFWDSSEAIEIYADGDSRKYGRVDGETRWLKSKLPLWSSGRRAVFGLLIPFLPFSSHSHQPKILSVEFRNRVSFILSVVTFRNGLP